MDMEPVLITILILFTWLIVGLGAKSRSRGSAGRAEYEAPGERVRLSCESDPSGRFVASGSWDKETGKFTATVTTKRHDIALIRFVEAETKEELETKVQEVYREFAKRWKHELYCLKLMKDN